MRTLLNDTGIELKGLGSLRVFYCFSIETKLLPSGMKTVLSIRHASTIVFAEDGAEALNAFIANLGPLENGWERAQAQISRIDGETAAQTSPVKRVRLPRLYLNHPGASHDDRSNRRPHHAARAASRAVPMA